MALNPSYIAIYTITRRELVRMFRISSQVFLPAVITTTLYLLIFGTLIGRRIGSVEHFPYALFITPGLIMMTVINNAYSNVSTSLFSARFQKSIEEILVSPVSDGILLFGYTIGGILRGVIVASLVFIIASFFVAEVHFRQLPSTLGVVILVAMLFSLAGFANALFAKTFDDIMLVPTFLLTPLTYLGGVFYSLKMLSPFLVTVSYFNPIWYMINALRFTMLQYAEADFRLSLGIILAIIIFLVMLNLWLLKKGVGLRE